MDVFIGMKDFQLKQFLNEIQPFYIPRGRFNEHTVDKIVFVLNANTVGIKLDMRTGWHQH